MMAELIGAYDALMDDDFAGRTSDSRVAASCEIFSIDELVSGGLHEVHAVRVLFDTAMLGEGANVAQAEVRQKIKMKESQLTPGSEVMLGDGASSSGRLHVVEAASDDSVSDLKRQLESKYDHEWGLEGRLKNREGTLMGWELIQEEGLLETGGVGTVVLSYHLFLHDYGIQSGDILHAVVRI